MASPLDTIFPRMIQRLAFKHCHSPPCCPKLSAMIGEGTLGKLGSHTATQHLDSASAAQCLTKSRHDAFTLVEQLVSMIEKATEAFRHQSKIPQLLISPVPGWLEWVESANEH